MKNVVAYANEILIDRGRGAGGSGLSRLVGLMGASGDSRVRVGLLHKRVVEPDHIDISIAGCASMPAQHKLIAGCKGVPGMPFDDIADPKQRAILVAALDDICLAAGIMPRSPESEHAAGLLLHLHRVGCRTARDLKSTFEQVTQRAWCA
jgi:hypothetical protein